MADKVVFVQIPPPNGSVGPEHLTAGLSGSLAENATQMSYKNNKVNQVENMTFANANNYELAWMDENDVCYYISGFGLYKSLDYGSTFTLLREFSTQVSFVREVNGELLVGTRQASDLIGGIIFKTSGNKTTWNQVLQLSAGALIISGWNVSVEKNIVILGEYGLKGSATKIYLSNNYGSTFTTICNIRDYAAVPDNTHCHGVCYDKWFERIWATYGDGNLGTNGNLGLMYTDDLGATWKKVNIGYQLLNCYAFEDRVVFFSDSAPNGVYSYERGTKDEEPQIEFMYAVDSKSYLTYLPSFIYKKDYKSPLIIGWSIEPGSAETAPTKFILATYNGKDYSEIWKDTINHTKAQSTFAMVAPTKNNKLIGTMTQDTRYTMTKFESDYSISVNTVSSAEKQDHLGEINIKRLGVRGDGTDETLGIINAINYCSANNKMLVIPRDVTIFVKDATVANKSNINIKCYGKIKLIPMSSGNTGNCLKFTGCSKINIPEFHGDGNVSGQLQATKYQALEHILSIENCQDVSVGILEGVDVGGKILRVVESSDVYVDTVLASSDSSGAGCVGILNSENVTVNRIQSNGIGEATNYDVNVIKIYADGSGKTTSNVVINDVYAKSAGRYMVNITTANSGVLNGVTIKRIKADVSPDFVHTTATLFNVTGCSSVKVFGEVTGLSSRKSYPVYINGVDDVEVDIKIKDFNKGPVIGETLEVKNSNIRAEMVNIENAGIYLGKIKDTEFKLKTKDCSLNATTPSYNITNVGTATWENIKFAKCVFGKGALGNFSACVTHWNVTASNVVFDDCDFSEWSALPMNTIFTTNNPGVLRKNCKGFNYQSAIPPALLYGMASEIVYNTSPAAGGYLGWVCTVSGKPATWKGFGLIEA